MYFVLLLLYALIDLWGQRCVTSHREATGGSFSLFTFLFYSLVLKDFGNTNKQQVKNNSVAPNQETGHHAADHRVVKPRETKTREEEKRRREESPRGWFHEMAT